MSHCKRLKNHQEREILKKYSEFLVLSVQNHWILSLLIVEGFFEMMETAHVRPRLSPQKRSHSGEMV